MSGGEGGRFSRVHSPLRFKRYLDKQHCSKHILLHKRLTASATFVESESRYKSWNSPRTRNTHPYRYRTQWYRTQHTAHGTHPPPVGTCSRIHPRLED